MKKSSGWNKLSGCPVQGLFMTGFLLGTLLPDILWKMEWHQKTIASMYLLRNFVSGSEERTEYLLQVFKIRGSVYMLGAVCGISVFGVPFAIAGSIYLGMKTGMLLTVSVLQFGLQGGLVGVSLMFPQYLLYIPCMFYLYDQSYRRSMRIWKNKGMPAGSLWKYFARVALCGLFYLGGMLTEVYCNPVILEWIIQKLNSIG